MSKRADTGYSQEDSNIIEHNSEIRCPHCGTIFKIDETDYAKLVSQVRDKEFSKEMEFRVQHYEKEKEDAITLAKAEEEKKHTELLNRTKDELKDEIFSRDNEIAQLKSRIEQFELEKSVAVKNAEDAKDASIQKKDLEIAELKAKQSNWENEKKLALSEAEMGKIEAVNSKDREIAELRAQMDLKDASNKNEQDSLKQQYELQLKLKDEQVEYYKDFKTKQSTKMIGESLERYCENEFNKLRATGFQNAYFDKDNQLSETKSKGDFIFRD